MRAAIQTQYGPPEVLHFSAVQRPTPRRREVLVQVHASSVTQGDRRLRAADFPGIMGPLGRLMTGLLSPRHRVGGSTFAGRVVALGADVTELRVGDDVFGVAMHGAYAEYLAVSVDGAMGAMPANVSYAEAAAIPYGAGTALHFLRDLAELRAGERVLILGAAGGVGRMAVQVAKHLGAHVTGVCSQEAAALSRELGADEVLDYAHDDVRTQSERWDVIFDTTQGEHFDALRPRLTDTGRYLSLYVTSRSLYQMLATKLRGGPRVLVGVALGNPARSAEVRALVERGALRATLAERFAFSDIVAAHRRLESPGLRGSVVVDVVPSTVDGRAQTQAHDRVPTHTGVQGGPVGTASQRARLDALSA